MKFKYEISAGIVLLAAFVLRFYGLGDTSLWLDEAVYANNSHTDFFNFIGNTRNSNSAPILLPFLYWLFGESIRDPFSIRLMPAFFSLGSVLVTLLLPKVGVPRIIAFISSIWITFLPSQIQYSQEVREYSLSVFIALILLYGFLRGLMLLHEQRLPTIFLLSIIIAPLASYGLVFLSGILLIIYFAIGYSQQRFMVRNNLIVASSFLVSCFVSFVLTAKYQMGIGKTWYLIDNYPPETSLASAKWIFHSLVNYFSFATGGLKLGVFSALLILVFSCFIVARRLFLLVESRIIIVWVGVLAASLALSFFGLYPFGGIRQHLFSTPLAILAATSAFVYLVQSRKVFNLYFCSTIFVIFIIAQSVAKLPNIYREIEDLSTPISRIENNTLDSQVFVYYGAVPAVNFHYPERHFYNSRAKRGDIVGMLDEVSNLENCSVYLVFTHIFKTEDEELVSLLTDKNYIILSDEKFYGSRLIKADKCLPPKHLKLSGDIDVASTLHRTSVQYNRKN